MRIIIIGATSGIGLALAREYAAGNQLILTGRDREKLHEIHSQFHQIKTACFDVKNENQISDFFASLNQSIDLVINCAGWGDLNPDYTWNIDKETFETNTIGFAKICHSSLELFKAQGFGHLAVITSVGGLLPDNLGNAYNATKSFQIRYIQGLQMHCKNLNISITEIRAGMIETKMLKSDTKFWVATPQKAARQIKIAIKKKKKLVYVSKRWSLIGFIAKHLLT